MIHPTAIISEGCQIADDVTIGPYSIIAPGTVIEHGARLGEYVRTGRNSVIKARAILQCRATISPDCVVGENTFIGPNFVTARMNVALEHQPVVIGARCFMGAGVIVGPGANICDDVVVGAGSFVKDPITKPGLYVGSPARFIRPLRQEDLRRV